MECLRHPFVSRTLIQPNLGITSNSTLKGSIILLLVMCTRSYDVNLAIRYIKEVYSPANRISVMDYIKTSPRNQIHVVSYTAVLKPPLTVLCARSDSECVVIR